MGNSRIDTIKSLEDKLSALSLVKPVKSYEDEYFSSMHELNIAYKNLVNAKKDLKDLRAVKSLQLAKRLFKLEEHRLENAVNTCKKLYSLQRAEFDKVSKKYMLALKHNTFIIVQPKIYSSMIIVLKAQKNNVILKKYYSEQNAILYNFIRKIGKRGDIELLDDKSEICHYYVKLCTVLVYTNSLIKNSNDIINYGNKYIKAVKNNPYTSYEDFRIAIDGFKISYEKYHLYMASIAEK
jgi:hypothetical protein